ncbi:hypothetical protein GGX14DRAFT_630200 [Mycena pura]|uniref:MYND-type domain-containing protein n=1 Tax=Mycena pura TaxID=153505 RepID=A0AAD7E4V0_9AGAR|nr:hypothetical protein GGX14DRAFT_630200 [Mycena pura]
MSSAPLKHRIFNLPIETHSVCLGVKGGVSWYIVYRRPIGVSRGPMAREFTCLNAYGPSYPMPPSTHLPEGTNPTFVLNGSETQGESITDSLVTQGILKHTGRSFLWMGLSTYPVAEFEVLLKPAEILQACEGCGNWEIAGRDRPRFLKCSGCRSRFYCSPSCQKSDWKVHKRQCSTLATGNEAAVQAAGGVRVHHNLDPITSKYHLHLYSPER